MNILFIHQNFPGQFKSLVPALLDKGHDISVLTTSNLTNYSIKNIKVYNYKIKRVSTKGIHPWLIDFETKIIRGEACALAAKELKSNGYCPDVIVAHHGWGESMFLKEIWPQANLGIYCEFYYASEGQDVGFDPEFPVSKKTLDDSRLKLKNLNNILHFDIADAAISPTRWQASTFPKGFREKIDIIHDGIDTKKIVPNKTAEVTLNTNGQKPIKLTVNDEIITFINRNLEPYRGYHIFMRSLPEILKNRPRCRVVIIGGDGVSYGAKPDISRYKFGTWKDIFIKEVKPFISESDWTRVHFVGQIPYSTYLSVLQISSCHVYMTYPFVLSWSLLEAMSVECPIVASDTAPVREVIIHNKTGVLTDFFDPKELSSAVIKTVKNSNKAKKLGKSARKFVVEHYDLFNVCLPRQIKWIERLARPIS